jgi:hypothetical protein
VRQVDYRGIEKALEGNIGKRTTELRDGKGTAQKKANSGNTSVYLLALCISKH